MRRFFALATSLAAMASIAACSQEPQQVPRQEPQQVPQQVPQQEPPQLAPEGRGLVPAPAEMPATLGGTPPEHPFVSEPWGGFSRTIFETDEDPDFKLVIRDFAFPPDKQPHTITLPSAAFLHFLGEPGEIRIAQQRSALTPVARTSVPAGAPIEVVNNGKYPVVVRVLIVEGK